jgi:hypothetical protein
MRMQEAPVPDKARINQAIDELQMAAIDEHQQYRAALTVCAEMERMGSSREEILEVLAALDLLHTADHHRSPKPARRDPDAL